MPVWPPVWPRVWPLYAHTRSLTLRLTLMFSLVSALVLVSVAVLVGLSVERHFEEQDLAEINAKLALSRRILGKLSAPVAPASLAAAFDDALFGQHGLAMQVSTPDALLSYTSMHGAAAFPATLLAAAPLDRPLQRRDLQVWQHGDEVYRGLALQLPTSLAATPQARVAIAVDIAHHQQFMAAFRHTLWIAITLGIAGSGLLGWLVARRGLLPLRRMAAVATGISAHGLHQRLDEHDVPSEMADLAVAFNAMFTRLEDSFRRLSDFSSDLAHELRTPISNLMMQTQVALAQARDGEAYREVLYSSLEEYERLSRIIADMLFLAKADNGQLLAGNQEVDLAAEVAELFEFYEALADEQGVHLSCAGSGQLRGDRLMLRRALSNLLSNAIRYTPAGGTVSVSVEVARRLSNLPSPAGEGPGVRATGGAPFHHQGWQPSMPVSLHSLGEHALGQRLIRLTVSNPGPAIAAEHLPRLFDRFYRAEAARQREEGQEGSGLGLAITRSIVAAHGGEISVTSGPAGSCFTVCLPG